MKRVVSVFLMSLVVSNLSLAEEAAFRGVKLVGRFPESTHTGDAQG